MSTDSSEYQALSSLLGEMQREMAKREWTSDNITRIHLAADFRGKLWAAIAAYRDCFCERSV
jgi:hypothetical protein